MPQTSLSLRRRDSCPLLLVNPWRFALFRFGVFSFRECYSGSVVYLRLGCHPTRNCLQSWLPHFRLAGLLTWGEGGPAQPLLFTSFLPHTGQLGAPVYGKAGGGGHTQFELDSWISQLLDLTNKIQIIRLNSNFRQRVSHF